MNSISIMWLAHRDAELANLSTEELTAKDPFAIGMIAFYDASRRVALGMERGELKPDDVCAEVDQFFLKLQDYMTELEEMKKREELAAANDES